MPASPSTNATKPPTARRTTTIVSHPVDRPPTADPHPVAPTKTADSRPDPDPSLASMLRFQTNVVSILNSDAEGVDHHLAEVGAGAHVLHGGGELVKREGAVEDGRDVVQSHGR
jgi:hypothetical protein